MPYNNYSCKMYLGLTWPPLGAFLHEAGNLIIIDTVANLKKYEAEIQNIIFV